MSLHTHLIEQHQDIRKQVEAVNALLKQSAYGLIDPTYDVLYKTLRLHLRQEDGVYYKQLDSDKKAVDRTLMHDLRNDHAALLFALDGLKIRIQKASWNDFNIKWKKFIDVLLPHMDKEEATLFPLGEQLLPSDMQNTLLKDMKALS